MKSKKKKNNEEDSSHLIEYFAKLKEKEKKEIRQIVAEWFCSTARKASQTISSNKLI